MSPEAARSVRELQMLESLVDCAHDLAQVYGAATKAERDTKRSLEFLDGFLRCGLAVRMGIRLSMGLRATLKATPVVERAEALEREPAEHDHPEPRAGVEREREREYEPVSLPKFLATLGVVARDAAGLSDQLPGATQVLPTLQGLLAQAAAPDPSTPEPAPSPTPGVAVARPPRPGARHLLMGSATTALSRPRPGVGAPWSGPG